MFSFFYFFFFFFFFRCLLRSPVIVSSMLKCPMIGMFSCFEYMNLGMVQGCHRRVLRVGRFEQIQRLRLLCMYIWFSSLYEFAVWASRNMKWQVACSVVIIKGPTSCDIPSFSNIPAFVYIRPTVSGRVEFPC